MNKTIVAIYDDIVVARQIVEDLVNADFARTAISLITNDAQNQYGHYLDKDYAPKNDAVTASEGAGFGAVVGGLTGVLVGLATLTIPGIGLAIAAGPIVAGLTGVLAGAITGGIVGALVKSGVPEDEAPYYAEAIRRGGTLVSIETSDTLRAQDIMNRHGAINIHERINLWRQSGWQGFNAKEHEDTVASSPETPTSPPHTTTTSIAPMTEDSDLVSANPSQPMIIEEPPIEAADTAHSLPVLVTPITHDEALVVTPAADAPITEPFLVAREKQP